MLSSPLTDKIPVNLIQQPVERGTMLIWLIAFAQFCNYAFSSDFNASIGWFVTAPILMAASVVVAIRVNNAIPLIVTFLSGAMMLSGLFDINLSAGINQDPGTITTSFIIMSLYNLSFWLLARRVLNGRRFQALQALIQGDNHVVDNKLSFQRFVFFLIFVTLNSLVVLGLFFPASDYQTVLLSSMVLLFVSGNQLSAKIRGLLLPLYVTLMIVGLLANEQSLSIYIMDWNAYDRVADTLMLALTGLSLLLWLSHNFFAANYNRIFPQTTINTMMWPWFGLLLLLLVAVQQSPDSFFSLPYLAFVLSYLFLMLRNSRSAIVGWSMIGLLAWLVLVVLSPLNPQLWSLKSFWQLGDYGLQSLWFAIVLIGFSIMWERYINAHLSHWGWQQVSFKKPVLLVGFLVAMIWLVVNLVLAAGLISGWFNLIQEGMHIEKTSLSVLLLFIALHFLLNNNWLANLVHLSAMIAVIVLWGYKQALPVYLLLALIHLLWVALPGIIRRVSVRWSLPVPEKIISTTSIWIYISFLAAIASLFQAMESEVVVSGSLAFLSSIAILFVASIVIIRQYSQQWWTMVSHLLAVGLLLSVRFMVLGDAPVNAMDTVAIMFVSLVLLVMNHRGLLTSAIIPANVLVKLVPLTALFTLPWQIASLHSSVTLLILGLFYLQLAKGSRLGVYTGLILLNLAVYLWMPLLSNHTNLMLFYMIPVSMTLLLISHLHRHEMRPAQRNAMRFLALSLLYIVVTADIFISESLLIFLMGLLLGLASVVYGVSSRTRAFLYAGVSFMVVVIVGQLIAFYPDGRLGRALILMASGAVITGSMIAFNIKREMLLEKIRLFRADLDSWN